MYLEPRWRNVESDCVQNLNALALVETVVDKCQRFCFEKNGTVDNNSRSGGGEVSPQVKIGPLRLWCVGAMSGRALGANEGQMNLSILTKPS